jgi:hypothetical protein
MFVINYMNGTRTLHNYTLQYMLDEIKRTCVSFSHIIFSHVYKEHNKEVDQSQNLDCTWNKEYGNPGKTDHKAPHNFSQFLALFMNNNSLLTFFYLKLKVQDKYEYFEHNYGTYRFSNIYFFFAPCLFLCSRLCFLELA